MKTGVFIGNTSPEIGGGHTLISTIIDEISRKEQHDDYIFIFSGAGRQRETVKNGVRFADLNWYKKKYRLGIIARNAGQSLKCVLRLKKPSHDRENYLEALVNDYNISFLWIAVPAILYSSRPYAFTVWDLGHRVLTEAPEMSRPIREWESREYMYQTMLGRATYIITGNEAGKKEILENYPVDPGKIVPIQFPITTFCTKEEKKPDIELDDIFFFYPAQFWSHKNHICILKALSVLKSEHNLTPQMIFSGSDKGNMAYVQRRCQELGLSDQVIFAGFLEYEEIRYLYTHANAMIFASFLGPNNLPPYEALYLGCPVICTDLEGHKEQMGEAALYFDGRDEYSLAKAVKDFLTEPEVKEKLIQEMKTLKNSLEGYNYSDRMDEVIQDFKKRRGTWSDD